MAALTLVPAPLAVPALPRYSKEVESTMERYYTALEEVKLQDMQIAELQKRILEGETKLKQQQNLYESVRADRNLYSKNLVEAQEEIGEMKRKFRIMNHQIEQLKEEVTAKDHALVQEHFDHHKVEKDKEMLQKELAKIRKQIQSSEQIIGNQDSEIQKLTQIIAEAEEEKSRQQKELESVVNERNILGSQLIRRNEELAKLYEKIKVRSDGMALHLPRPHTLRPGLRPPRSKRACCRRGRRSTTRRWRRWRHSR